MWSGYIRLLRGKEAEEGVAVAMLGARLIENEVNRTKDLPPTVGRGSDGGVQD
jgi:hypothetical protein